MKTFEKIGDRLVSITTEFVYPPVPIRDWDWNARYSTDESECPNYGWGATAELAIQDLLDSYDPDETGHDYEPDFSAPTAREEQIRNYEQKYNL